LIGASFNDKIYNLLLSIQGIWKGKKPEDWTRQVLKVSGHPLIMENPIKFLKMLS